MPKSGGEQLSCLIRAPRLYAPLLGTRYHHRGVVGLQLGFGLPLRLRP